MIIYNVTVKVETGSAEEWVAWMKTEHMPELLGTALFTDARLCRLLEQDEADGITFSAQYSCPDRLSYDAYIEQHATMMREKSFKRFGNKFAAFRTLMEVL